MRLLGLDLPVPDHTTLSRRADDLAVPPLPRVLGRSQSFAGANGMHLIVDSTGLKFHGPGEWLVEKHGTKTRRPWRKLHIGLDADTGEIAAVELTRHDIDDGSQVGPLLEQIAGPIASFTGDGAYDTTHIYATAAARHLVTSNGLGILSCLCLRATRSHQGVGEDSAADADHAGDGSVATANTISRADDVLCSRVSGLRLIPIEDLCASPHDNVFVAKDVVIERLEVANSMRHACEVGVD
jgi:hypothetical protein